MSITDELKKEGLITMDDALMDESYIQDTIESAGCDGSCSGAPKTDDGFPDCSKCPNRFDKNFERDLDE